MMIDTKCASKRFIIILNTLFTEFYVNNVGVEALDAKNIKKV
ncbi:hypothetical protein PFLA_b1335 [Pseudoalteromonas flavipulchra NCIMB 2033 = ATCC BAA-314]|nr:hypothetical protein [Pseudoalteromonas flavipulchra NCIMB 2033 = ATCC BAA-314]